MPPCQHRADGGRDGSGAGGRTGRPEPARPMVAPWTVRASRCPTQCRHRPHLPVRLLRRHPAVGQPPQSGRGAGPHQRGLPGPRRPPRGRRPGRLHPAHPCRPAPRRPDPVPPVPDQPLDPGPQPRVPRGHSPRGGPRVPADDPVGGDRCRHRLRPRDPGHRLGRGAQRHLLVRAGRLPGDQRVPGAGRPGARLDIGVHPRDGGRRRRGGPPGCLRWALLPTHPGSGPGQSHHPRGVGPHPLPRRRPLHLAPRAPGPAVRGAHGGSGPAGPGRRLGGGQLAARRRLALGLRGRLRPRDLADRPAHRLRPRQHPGRRPHHPRRPRRGRVRPGDHAGRLRADRRPGPVGRPGLSGRELLAADPLRWPRLRLARARARFRAATGLEAGPQRAGPHRPGAG